MKKRYALAIALSAASLSGTAQSATMITFVGGGQGLTGAQILFADFNAVPDNSTSAPGFVSGGNGYIVLNPPPNTGSGADPNPSPPGTDSGDNYLSVLGGGSATYSFGAGVNEFGFDYGSADTYNSLTLFFTGGGPNETYGGTALLNGGNANGNQFAAGQNGRLTIGTSDSRLITGFRLASSSNSMEIDNLGAVVPEPATWAMMLIGFGAVGYSMRRRRSDARMPQLV